MYHVHVVENVVQASNTVESMRSSGYEQKQIYIFAHDKYLSEQITDGTDTGEVGIKEQGIFESIGNVFRDRGDELRSKMRSLGLSQVEAEQMEEKLDEGKLILIGSNQADSTYNRYIY
ncbi:general stress protein [Cytobacillus sp. FJAT-54145]|uniref:General stress protein n=1 Tax=Cytobacillus spartinae TaxID=3299023 RepID=A0ABW6KCJ5_9BACI